VSVTEPDVGIECVTRVTTYIWKTWKCQEILQLILLFIITTVIIVADSLSLIQNFVR